MPRKPMPWFRFYVEAVHDRKLRRLDPAIRWTWVCVLAMTRRSPEPPWLLIGEGQPADEHDVSDVAAVPVKTAKTALRSFEKAGMLEFCSEREAWKVVNWDDRQYVSDNVTKRTQKHRARSTNDDGRNDVGTFQTRSMERSQPVPGNGVTPLLERSRSVTDTETDTDSEKSSPLTVVVSTGSVG